MLIKYTLHTIGHCRSHSCCGCPANIWFVLLLQLFNAPNVVFRFPHFGRPKLHSKSGQGRKKRPGINEKTWQGYSKKKKKERDRGTI